jgi:hypothetical protein
MYLLVSGVISLFNIMFPEIKQLHFGLFLLVSPSLTSSSTFYLFIMSPLKF